MKYTSAKHSSSVHLLGFPWNHVHLSYCISEKLIEWFKFSRSLKFTKEYISRRKVPGNGFPDASGVSDLRVRALSLGLGFF